MNLTERHGLSVICGHTHRAGLTHKTHSSGGKVIRTLWGFEVGNLMNFKDAGYLKAGSGNWTQGFGLLYEDKNGVQPVFVGIERDGSFVVEGRRYG